MTTPDRRTRSGVSVAEVLAAAQRYDERFARAVSALGDIGPDGLTSLDRMAEHEDTLYADRGETVGRGSTVADPTGQAAVELHPKPLSQVRERLRNILDFTCDIERLVIEHSPPIAATGDDASANADPGCQPCARLGVWSPPYRTGTVGGLLDYAQRLCQWDYRHVMATGELAPEAIRKQYLAGKDPVIRVQPFGSGEEVA